MLACNNGNSSTDASISDSGNGNFPGNGVDNSTNSASFSAADNSVDNSDNSLNVNVADSGNEIDFCAAAVLAFAGAVSAQEAPAPEAAEVLSLEEMEALAGGAGVHASVVTEQMLNAVNDGNSVNGEIVNSGQVNIGANAFSGYSGMGNFVINTGHNNNLQSSMSVSVVLAPPTGP